MRQLYDIGIAGCGPAGLAAALLLHRDGHRVTLFERFEQPRPVGSGLMIQPSGLAVLADLGLAQEVAARGSRIDSLFGRTESGRVALDAPYARLGLPGAFGIGIHRASLFDILHAAVQAAGIAVETCRDVAGVVSSGHSRRFRFADGTRAEAFDLLVDASGWQSALDTARRRVLGFGALWSSLPVTPSDPYAPNLLEQRYRGARQMAGVLPIGARGPGQPSQVAFFWSLACEDHARWCVTPLAEWKGAVLALWPELAWLLDRIETRDQLTFARYAHRTAAVPQDARLARIGDAWHSASPQLGQGANMALLDAFALAQGLREGRSATEALRLARSWRKDHVGLYQWVTALFTPLYQSQSAFLPVIRDRVVAPLARLGPVARLQALLMSGLFGSPLAILGLAPPDYEAIAASMAARASSPAQSKSPATRQTSRPSAS